jgi:hypothetical protein
LIWGVACHPFNKSLDTTSITKKKISGQEHGAHWLIVETATITFRSIIKLETTDLGKTPEHRIRRD